MAAVNSVSSSRLPLPAFSPRVLMYSAAVGGEGAVALQLREAAPAEIRDLELRRTDDRERLAIACHEPELLADLLHAAADIGDHEGLSALLGSPSPLVLSDTSDSLPLPDHELECTSSSSTIVSGVATVSVASAGTDHDRAGLDHDRAGLDHDRAGLDHDRAGLDSFDAELDHAGVTLDSIGAVLNRARTKVDHHGSERQPVRKVRPKPTSPIRQGPQQCQTCNKIFGNASALAKHKLTHSDERKYVCVTCGKAFKRQDHLNGHMLTHRNKKPYECKAEGCGKSYCDARSLRRHTENHHQQTESLLTGEAERESCIRLLCPLSPLRSNSDSSNSSDKGTSRSSSSSNKIGTANGNRNGTKNGMGPNGTSGNVRGSGKCSGEGSPPGTPPAPPRTPPAKKPRVRTKNSATTLQASQKCSSSVSAGNTTGRPVTAHLHDVKQVECNLCHRKFKNIPALNGHMRLHGGYFKKDTDSKKLDKKESTGPPLQTASVSVRALIEEKIISRRGATAALVPSTASTTETAVSTAGFVAPAPPPLSSLRPLGPSSPATSSTSFVPPRPPSVITTNSNVSGVGGSTARDPTLIELLKKGNLKAVKRSASDPGQCSPQQDFTFRPEMFGVSFNSDDGYFSPALNEDTFPFTTTPEQLEDLASLEEYASVSASIRERSPGTFPSNRRLAAVLNSPLPESLADFGACHGGSPVPSPGLGYSSSPCLSYSTGDSPGLPFTAPSPGGYTQPMPSPGLGYPTPPASHDALSPAHTVPRASSPLSAAFFTATMSSQEEVEEALEEVLPEECRSLDAYSLDMSPSQRIMLNSEDPMLSSNPRDFHQRSLRRYQRVATASMGSMSQWQQDTSLQVCVEGRDTVPAVFLSPSSVPASPRRARKRRAQQPAGPYRTRMRRTLRHYTPRPILPPEREGSGLFGELSLTELSETNVPSPLGEPPRPQINIGSDFQADLPELCNDRIDLHRVPEQLLWDPGINDALDDNEVRMFMELAMCAAMPVGGHTREYALQALGECGGDIRAATLRLMTRPATPSEQQFRWTPEEVEAFLAGLGHYDKDFHKIAQLIRTKDSKQCVQFYYFWKKVTRDYKTLYLRSWHIEQQATQGSIVASPQSSASVTSSPNSYDGGDFPCKICGKVFNKVKSRSAHMKSHRPNDAEPKRHKFEKPYEKVDKTDDRTASADYQNKPPTL